MGACYPPLLAAWRSATRGPISKHSPSVGGLQTGALLRRAADGLRRPRARLVARRPAGWRPAAPQEALQLVEAVVDDGVVERLQLNAQLSKRRARGVHLSMGLWRSVAQAVGSAGFCFLVRRCQPQAMHASLKELRLWFCWWLYKTGT